MHTGNSTLARKSTTLIHMLSAVQSDEDDDDDDDDTETVTVLAESSGTGQLYRLSKMTRHHLAGGLYGGDHPRGEFFFFCKHVR